MKSSVSIIIPCFNAERYLEATLVSALSQTVPPLEVIVVDDHSTDRSRAIAAAHSPQVIVLDNPGKGASAARNTGTSHARGEFLQYLDADDLLEPHAIASRTRALEDTGADVAIGDWQRYLFDGSLWSAGGIESGALPEQNTPADVQVLRGFWAPPAAILYRRTLCEKIGRWQETLPIIQDARFLLDAGRLGGRFIHFPGVSARYRQHRADSLSSGAKPALFWRDVLQNTREVELLWRAAGRIDTTTNEALAGAYAHCARVGFLHDRSLFEDALVDFRRFPSAKISRFLRTALMLKLIVGYRFARELLARRRRS
ncbi:MAG: glycosyltransferase [Verrucomicrobia bacterium]|nr:glycosyltransferase [Verrucomicrobiota bacterium]